jgi:hypothetical protein
MPHDDEEAVAFHAAAIRENARLNDDNAQLRALVDHLCGEIRKIAAELSKLIDKDNH